MLKSIIENLQSQLGQELSSKAGLPTDMVKNILGETGSIATKEVKKEAMSGGIDTLMNLFSAKSNSKSANNLQKNITDALSKSLVQKFGLSKEKSQMVTSIIVPALLNMISKENSKTPDSDPSPLQSLFDLAGGGKEGAGGAIGSLLGKFLKK